MFPPQYLGPIIQANQALKYLQANVSNQLFIDDDSAGTQIASRIKAIITNEALAKSMDIQTFVDKKQLISALLFCGVYNMEK